MDVYLDTHSTTRCDPRVVEAMLPYFTEHFGNAASRSHKWGYAARIAVEAARAQIAGRIGASPKEVVFTSGATESNNLAILGSLRANPAKNHVVTVVSEHKAVLDCVEQAEAEGFTVTRVAPRQDGRVDPNAVEAALTDRTGLVSVMWVNNETGTIQPIAELAELCASRGIGFHTDAAQALASVPIDLRAVPVDLMSLSAHKAYGPKGVGALYVRRTRPRIVLQPLQYGGGHERGMRSGTLAVPLIVGFGVAAGLFDPGELAEIAARRDRLQEALLGLGDVTVNGSIEHRVAGNLNVTLAGVESKALMMGCKSIAMSSGSACTSESLSPSHVLLSMGIDSGAAAESIRFGLGRFTSDIELDWAVEQLLAKAKEIRSMEGLLDP